MKCKYDESSTVGTMFDKCKFTLLLAFYIAFKISTKKKGMSTLELSQEFELRQKTCWEFKWKIQQAMVSSKLYPINGIVHVDEFNIGGEEESKQGRSKGDKKLVIVALEIIPGGVGRAYAQCIGNASANSVKPFFETYIELTLIYLQAHGYFLLHVKPKCIFNLFSYSDIHLVKHPSFW